MKMTTRQIQQGDVLIRSTLAIPHNVTRKKDNVLAWGEVTFHKHEVIGEGVEVWEDDTGVLYVSAPLGGRLQHEEHGPIALAPGNYQVGIVQEYDHFNEEAKNVAD